MWTLSLLLFPVFLASASLLIIQLRFLSVTLEVTHAYLALRIYYCQGTYVGIMKCSINSSVSDPPFYKWIQPCQENCP